MREHGYVVKVCENVRIRCCLGSKARTINVITCCTYIYECLCVLFYLHQSIFPFSTAW